MEQERNLLGFLTTKPQRDAEEVERLRKRFDEALAPVFRPVADAILAQSFSEFWLKGGRGSCKSSSASEIIVRALYEDVKANALVIRKVGETLRDSVYAQMVWALDMLGVADQWEYTVSPMEITHKVTGQKIYFRGLDKPQKIKSIRPKKGYFAVVWFEELEEFSSYDELRSVMQSAARGKGANAIAIMSYNPPKSAANWVNEECLANAPWRMVHHSSYLDIPPDWLGEKFLADAEALKARNLLAWEHDYGGKVTGEGGNVFHNLTLRTLTADELSACQSRAMHGLDFGFSNDPSALMDTAYFESPDGAKRLYVFGEFYKAGAGFNLLEKEIKRASKLAGSGYAEVWCDTEPRTIAELAGRGCRVAAARKGKNSRQFGMEWLEELDEIIIDKARCANAAKEFSAFEHARNKDGRWRADYQDGNDHTIDAVRYSCWRVIFRSKRKKNYSGRGAR